MRGLILIVALMGACGGQDCPSEARGLVDIQTVAAWPDGDGDCVTPYELLGACDGALQRFDDARPSLASMAISLAGAGGEYVADGTTCEPDALATGPDGRSARVYAVYTGDGYDLRARVTVPETEFGGSYACCYVGRMAPHVSGL